MARRVETTLVDDLDGSAADRTVAFGVEGKEYEIDLSESNLARFNEAVGPWVGAARKAGKATRGKGGGAAAASDRSENHAIREWARAEGFQVTARGRLPGVVVTAYRAQVG
jgi:hypothetical protein